MHKPFEKENIFRLLGVQSLSLEKRQQIMEAAVDTVYARMINRVLEELPEDARERLAVVIADTDVTGMDQIIRDHDIDIETILEEEIERVKEEMVEKAHEVEQA